MTKPKFLTVVGARPQFIKLAAVSPVLRRVGSEVIVHTGQHYDPGMSDVFFSELGIPRPDYNLGIGSGSHGYQTGRIMETIEEVMMGESPDWVIVYGDTNSTLAGAITAAKCGFKVAHVESGLRSFDRSMPEETNRAITDHVSDVLFAPTETAMRNLSREGLESRAVLVGDVMADLVLKSIPSLSVAQDVERSWDVTSKEYVLLTLHRPCNVDSIERLRSILQCVAVLKWPVVFPVHPRTRARIQEFGLGSLLQRSSIITVDPVGYLHMLTAVLGAKAIITDSGGLQKEAYILTTPCITLRESTEWPETLKLGWNTLASPKAEEISRLVDDDPPAEHPMLFGDGHSAERIVSHLCSLLVCGDDQVLA